MRIDISKLATNEKERRHGFECPLSFQQLFTWVNTATTVASAVAWLVLPILSETSRLSDVEESSVAAIHGATCSILIIAFIVSLFMTVKLAYICTAAIPTDILCLK